MAIKKIEMRPSDNDYQDVLYPKTSSDMVVDPNNESNNVFNQITNLMNHGDEMNAFRQDVVSNYVKSSTIGSTSGVPTWSQVNNGVAFSNDLFVEHGRYGTSGYQANKVVGASGRLDNVHQVSFVKRKGMHFFKVKLWGFTTSSSSSTSYPNVDGIRIRMNGTTVIESRLSYKNSDYSSTNPHEHIVNVSTQTDGTSVTIYVDLYASSFSAGTPHCSMALDKNMYYSLKL